MKFVAQLCWLYVIIAIGWSHAQELRRQGGAYETTIEKLFVVEKGGSLSIEGLHGEVVVSGHRRANAVEISEQLRLEVMTENEAKKIVEKFRESYRQTGNRVYISGRPSRRNVAYHAMTVRVPAEFDVDISGSAGDVRIGEIKGRVEARTRAGDIELTHIDGSIELSTSGGDLRLTEIRGRLRARTSGGDIEMTDIHGISDVHTSGGSVYVRKASAEITLSTSGGSIELEEISAPIDARTSGGSIRARDCLERVRLRTSGGDLRLVNMGGPVDARTSGGDIIGRQLRGAVVLMTSGGDIELQDVRASTRASTSGGDIELELALGDFRKPHSVDLRTSAGDITIFLPEKLPARLVAEIRLDRRRWRMDRYDIYSDFPISKQKIEEGGREILRGEGEINGGGDLISLSTSTGDIRIKKLRK